MQGEDASKWIVRDLAQPFQNGDEVWMSCLIQPIVRADGGFWIRPNGRQDIAIGKRWGWNLAIDNNDSGISVQENVVTKLVVRYRLESNQTVAHLWVNRSDNFTDANADATKTITAVLGDINSVHISMERWGDGVMEVDELHIGCSPEPESNCIAGSSCDDNDPCTENDVYDANCNCLGTFADADSDGVCDANDVCLTGDDTLDGDGDGIPDACDACPTGNNCNTCTNLLPQQQNLILGGRSMIIIRGVDPATHTWTDTDAELATFNTEMDTYLRNVSFNKAWIDPVDITPVYNFTVDPNNNGYYAMGLALRAIAQSNGYNVDNYNVVIYIHESTTDFGGAGALGSGNGMNGTVWSNNNLTYYFSGNIHETFHALGVGHAETIEGGTEIFPGQPTGGHDPYHFMGSQGDAGMDSDIPNYMKYLFGWIEPTNVSCIPTSGCNTQRIYKASLVNTYDAQRQYAAQLGDNLWISYEPDNANSRIEKKGVLLHYIPGPGSAVTRLIDTSPESITELPAGVGSNYLPVIDFWDAAMEVGDQVTWIGGEGISILNSGGTGDDQWVDIQVCDCFTVSGDDDNDGVCNTLDVCPQGDDTIDLNNNGVPDFCDDGTCTSETTEDFDYTANTGIGGRNGGTGFSDAWTTPTLNGSFEVVQGSLSFGSQASTGNKLRVTLTNESGGKETSRTLAEPFPNGREVWVSCLINPIAVADGGFWIRPNNNQAIALGKRWGSEIGIDNNGTGIYVQANQTYQLVARYRLESNQTVVHLWVNRTDNFTDANADATKTVGAIANISTIHLAMSQYGDGIMEIDELQIQCTPLGSCNPALLGTPCDDGDPNTMNDTFDADCNCTGTMGSLDLKLFLGGAYNSSNGLMNTVLYNSSLLPISQPYNATPWNYTGMEMRDVSYAPPTANDEIVDWVLVQLLDKTDPNTVLYSKAALLLADGDIVEADGVSPLVFDGMLADDYYIAVRHRNHLGVRSSTTMAVGSSAMTFDFTTTATYGANSQNTINGTYVLHPGDATSDGSINAADRSATWNIRNQTGYLLEDVNIDGSVNAADRSITWNNRNKSSQLP